MAQDQIDYKAVRRRVEEGLKRRKTAARWVFFIVSLFMVILFSIIGFGIAASQGALNNEDVAGAMVMLAMGGFMSVMFQFISLILETKAGEANMRERLIARELGEEMLRMGTDEDVREKRKRVMRIASDGELEEIVDESPSDVIIDEEQPRQRRSGQ
ncbi:MAG: hypothetical protein U0694_18460 [Anaerolineae bacterium]